MKIVLDTHAHTLASGHAYNTIREMAKAAADKGLEAIALTDHAPDMPGSCHLFYFQNLRVVPRNQCGVKLFLGTEANILDENGSVDLPDSVLAEMDLVIASIHPPCSKGAKTKKDITNAYLAAMENPHIDIIGHPDDGRFMVDYEAIVKKAKETHTLLELNNSSLRPGGFRVNTRENDLEMLRLCKKYEVPISIGSDAHVDVDLAGFDLAMEVLKECEFPEELVVNTSLERLEKILAI